MWLSQRWEEEEREVPLALHRARCLWELQANGAAGAVPVPAFLDARAAANRAMPQVEIAELDHGDGGYLEERDGMVKYVMQDMASELYIELMAGFHFVHDPQKCFWEEWGHACSHCDQCGESGASEHGDY